MRSPPSRCAIRLPAARRSSPTVLSSRSKVVPLSLMKAIKPTPSAVPSQPERAASTSERSSSRVERNSSAPVSSSSLAQPVPRARKERKVVTTDARANIRNSCFVGLGGEANGWKNPRIVLSSKGGHPTCRHGPLKTEPAVYDGKKNSQVENRKNRVHPVPHAGGGAVRARPCRLRQCGWSSTPDRSPDRSGPVAPPPSKRSRPAVGMP